MWLTGNWREGEDGPWDVLGIFSTEKRAINACTKDTHFIGPLPLNKRLPDLTVTWPGCYYPKKGKGR